MRQYDNNPMINGKRSVRVSKIGHRYLRGAGLVQEKYRKLGYQTKVVKDNATRRYFVFRSKGKKVN